MEVEIKLKVPESEIDRIKKILSERCEQKEEFESTDLYFSHPCRDMRKNDEALRLRIKRSISEEKAELTFKGRRTEEKGVKSREEISVQVNDWKKTLSILEAVGFSVFASIKKYRIDFDCSSFMISLDRVENLGSFIEIEGKERCNVDCVLDAMKSLDIKGEIEKRTYLELFLSIQDKNR